MPPRGWALALCPLLLGSAPSEPRSPRACPPALAPDGPREAALRARLSADPEAATLLRGAAPLAFCFGPDVEPAVTTDGAVLLPLALSLPATAARAAHLVRHRRPGSPLTALPVSATPADCARWVEAALDEEARAHALELRLLDAAGEPSALPFRDAARAAPEGHRHEPILRWFHEHPDGASAVPPLAASYAARCAHEHR